MALDFGKFLIGDVFDVYATDPSTSELLALITDSNDVTIKNGQDTFYATGKLGANLKSFHKSKTAAISGTNGSMIEGLMAVQTGSAIETLTNVSTLKYPVPFTSTGTTVVLTYDFKGTIGAEIKYLYAMNTDGSVKAKYAQGATASATVFSYASATKTLTLPTGVTNTSWLILACPTIATAKKVSNDVDKFSKTAEITAKVRVDEVCGSISHVGLFHMPQADFSGEWEISTGDKSAVHAWSADASSGCGSKLWDLYIFDESDLA